MATAMQKMVAGEKLHSDKPILVQPSGVILRHSANHLALEDPLLRRAMSFLSERMQTQVSIGILCEELSIPCLLYTSPSPRDRQKSRMPSSA